MMAIPVTVDGVEYSTKTEAAEALVVSRPTLERWIAAAGGTDRVESLPDMRTKGNRKGKVSVKPDVAPGGKDGQKRTVVIDGVPYGSMTEAAKARGVSRQAVYNWLNGTR